MRFLLVSDGSRRLRYITNQIKYWLVLYQRQMLLRPLPPPPPARLPPARLTSRLAAPLVLMPSHPLASTVRSFANFFT